MLTAPTALHAYQDSAPLPSQLACCPLHHCVSLCVPRELDEEITADLPDEVRGHQTQASDTIPAQPAEPMGVQGSTVGHGGKEFQLGAGCIHVPSASLKWPLGQRTN